MHPAPSIIVFTALSGAGYPGVPRRNRLGHRVPHIGGEDGKLENEPKKLLGAVVDGVMQLADIRTSAQGLFNLLILGVGLVIANFWFGVHATSTAGVAVRAAETLLGVAP